MRVISGKYRGRRLLSPADSRVRPTTDRIKETMFNILASRGGLYGAVLDLFSGSGALGIEALSRGAASAVFIDKDPDSIRLTKKVFLLWNSGTPKAEIAKECDISPEKVNRILEWDE